MRLGNDRNFRLIRGANYPSTIEDQRATGFER
jgi:hypothetical protein